MFCLNRQIYLGVEHGIWGDRIVNYDTGQEFILHIANYGTDFLYFTEISKGKYKQLDKCPFDVDITNIVGLVPRKDGKGFIKCFISKEAWYCMDLVDSVETLNIYEIGDEFNVFQKIYADLWIHSRF